MAFSSSRIYTTAWDTTRYTSLLTGHTIASKIRSAIGFIPATMLAMGGACSLIVDFNQLVSPAISFKIILSVIAASLLTTLVRSIVLVRKFSVKLKDNYSNIEKISLKWLTILLVLFSAIISATIAGDFAAGKAFHFWLPLFALMGYLIVMFGFLNPGYFSSLHLEKTAKDNSMPKYAKSALSSEKILEIETKIEEAVISKSLHLIPDLRLTDLSQAIGSSSHLISQVLNEKKRITFYDYINELRVNHAKGLLADPGNNQMKILAVALDSGFSSLSTFNAAFKRYSGKTPTEFRKNPSTPIG